MKTLARILGSVLLLGVLAWHLDWGELGAAFRHLDWRLWALAAGVLILAQCVSSWRWLLLARVLHFGGSLQRFVAYYFIGILFNLVLPTSVGGDVVRAWYLSSQEGSAPATGRRLEAFLTVFAERFSGVVVLLVLACVSTLFCPVSLPVYITGVIAVIGTGTVAGLFVLTWLCSLAAKGAEPAGTGRGVLGWILSRVLRLGAVRRLLEVSRRYWGRRDVILVCLGLSVVVQLASVEIVWLVARALGLQVPWIYLGVAIPVVSLVTLLPISVNGLGLREASLVLLLQPVGVAKPQAIAVSVLWYGLTVAVGVTFGLCCYLFGRFPHAFSSRALKEDPHDTDPVRGDSDQGRTGQPPTAA